MGELREWEAHVFDRPGKAACGAGISAFSWNFVDRDHAMWCMGGEASRLVPCDECARALFGVGQWTQLVAMGVGRWAWDADGREVE